MKEFIDLKNKNITVMGLGLNRGGLGITKFLAQSGANVLVTDLKGKNQLQKTLDELKDYNIEYVLGCHKTENFIGKDMIIQNPGVPNNSKYLQIARELGTPIETDLSLFLKICPSNNFIAVAGTKGKSTVTNFIFHLFSYANKDIVHGGNIGISVFDVLPEIKEKTFVLLEISSWQLEGMKKTIFNPKIAVLTNIIPDHLDRYKDFEEYANSEKLICQYLNTTNFLITSFDNPITKKIEQEKATNIFWFSTKNNVPQGCYLEDGSIIFCFNNQKTVICNIDQIPIPGEHNIGNTMAAINAAFLMNLPINKIREGIKTFKGVPNRLERIANFNDIYFYNDTCATTPEATIAAIKSFPKKPITLILGGRNKKLKYDTLCQAIRNSNNILSIVILKHPEYDASEIILKELNELGLKPIIKITESMQAATKTAYEESIPGTIILLSPGATSFGMFQNEFDRGNSFRQSVSSLIKL